MTLTLRSVNQVARLLLQLAALLALGWWGASHGPGQVGAVVLGVGIPLVALIVWLLYAAPGSRAPTSPLARLAIELGILLLAVLAIAAQGHLLLAWLFTAAVVVNGVLLYGFDQR